MSVDMFIYTFKIEVQYLVVENRHPSLQYALAGCCLSLANGEFQ